MAAHLFSQQEREDVDTFMRIYNFAKVQDVERIINEAEEKKTSPSVFFRSLYKQYNVKPLPNREGVVKRLKEVVPMATDADIESILRQTEMKGFTEKDAERALMRKLGVKQVRHADPVSASAGPQGADAAATSRAGGIDPTKVLHSGPTRAMVDDVMAGECRDWIAKVVGDKFNAEVKSADNFVDALRSGVVLSVLFQKLRNQDLADDAVVVPKRSTGFWARDTVVRFLSDAATEYDLVPAQLFTDADLCDGKNDRAVLTCLLSIARIAYKRGATKIAPSVVVFEQEIDEQSKKITADDIDKAIQEAENEQDVDEEEEEMEEVEEIVEEEVDEEEAEEQAGETKKPAEEPIEPREATPEAKVEQKQSDEAREKTPAPIEGQKDTDDASQKKAVERGASEPQESVPEPTETAKPEDAAVVEEKKSEAAASETEPTETQREESKPATLAELKDSNDHEESIPPPVPEDTRELISEERAASPPAQEPSPEKPEVRANLSASPVSAQDAASPPPVHPPQDDDDTKPNPLAPGFDASVSPPPAQPEEPVEKQKSVSRTRVVKKRVLVVKKTAAPAPEAAPKVEPVEKVVNRVEAAPAAPKNTNASSHLEEAPKYRARRWDELDVHVGIVVNTHFTTYPYSQVRFRRLSNIGEYVVYHRLSGHKQVIYVRFMQGKLMIRTHAGGNANWVPFNKWLSDYEDSVQ